MDAELKESDLKHVDFWAEGFTKLTQGSPNKATIVEAITYTSSKTGGYFLPNADANSLDDMKNWSRVDIDDFNREVDKYYSSSNSGRRALIRVLDALLRMYRLNCLDTNDYLALVTDVNKIMTKKFSHVSAGANSATSIAAVTSSLSKLGTEEKYKINGLPKYSGERSENLEDWIFAIDIAVENNNVPDNKIMGIVAPLLKETALRQ